MEHLSLLIAYVNVIGWIAESTRRCRFIERVARYAFVNLQQELRGHLLRLQFGDHLHREVVVDDHGFASSTRTPSTAEHLFRNPSRCRRAFELTGRDRLFDERFNAVSISGLRIRYLGWHFYATSHPEIDFVKPFGNGIDQIVAERRSVLVDQKRDLIRRGDPGHLESQPPFLMIQPIRRVRYSRLPQCTYLPFILEETVRISSMSFSLSELTLAISFLRSGGDLGIFIVSLDSSKKRGFITFSREVFTGVRPFFSIY